MRYLAWGPSRRWRGEVIAPPFAPITLPNDIIAALDASPDAPPFLGSASKHFDDVFSRLFHGWDNKLLSPDDARATAEWIEGWVREAPGRESALGVAQRLRAAAEHDWYFDWE
ncbi:hypothetical protein [uncultured Schumannella sp.]|uniref:hypothetical protein n=1 Tax=uncultured Schumannella sp. TaxID=1195956 RepID=UPI0025DD2A97|nr:hypothetical protein [uncultured Schumannella sp.]